MKSPLTGKEMRLSYEIRNTAFRKENFDIPFQYYLCEDTGEQFTSEQLDEVNFNLLQNHYRAIHHIPLPDEIASIRMQYDVSPSRMGEILGFGPNTYGTYEKGEVPNLSHSNLIKMAKDPAKFLGLVKDWIAKSDTVKAALIAKVESLVRKKQTGDDFLEEYFMGGFSPGGLTGFRTPSYRRLTEVIVYFAQEVSCFKTKMNKLLFYADFEMFRSHGQSITGAVFKAIPFGPVPNNFESIFERLAVQDIIDLDYEDLPNGGQKQFLKGRKDRQFQRELFSEEELIVLERVRDRFKNVKPKEIVEISRLEAAWIENHSTKSFINYGYALELKGMVTS